MNWIKRHKKLCICLVVIALFLGWRRYDGHFTPQRWAETDVEYRGKLVNSLLEQYDGLKGMTRAEVEALLGPDTNGEQREDRLQPDGSWETTPMLVYRTDGRPWALVPEYLFIYLEDGRVAQAKLVAD